MVGNWAVQLDDQKAVRWALQWAGYWAGLLVACWAVQMAPHSVVQKAAHLAVQKAGSKGRWWAASTVTKKAVHWVGQ